MKRLKERMIKMARVRVSKYLNQMQVVEGVTFSTVSYFKGKVEEAFALYKEFTVNQHATHRYAMAKLKVRGLDKYLEK